MVTSSYIYIPVGDLEEAAEWYIKAFGFMKITHDKLFFELRGAGTRVILIPKMNDEHSQMAYGNMVQAVYGFTVGDLSAMREKLSEMGSELTDVIDYAGLSCKFHDPYGNAIELWQE
jgi:predicted enzyme related to lactoylglutathione lyase